MIETPVTRVAAQMSDADLLSVRDALNTYLTEAILAGVEGTQAHVGQLEMLAAVAAEIYNRPVRRRPPYIEVSHETIGGDPATRITLSRAIRVF